jgi:multiple sugar transport system substrate-binding protein
VQRRTFLSLALAGSAAAGLSLSGCGSDASSDASVLNYWLWQDDATDQTWQQLADQFNQSQTDFKVQLQVIPLAQYQDKLVGALSSGGGPDACRFKDWWLGQLVEQNAIASLDDQLSGWADKSDVVPALFATGKVPGKETLYMLPHQYTTLYMYYRKSYFDKAGLSAPKTHADVLSACAKLTDPSAKRFGLDVRGGGGGQDQWAAWMFSGGARFVDPTGAITMADAKAVSVNADYLSIESSLKAAPPGSTTAAFAQVLANFSGGSTAMMIHHPGSLSGLRDAFKDDLGVVPLPSADAAQPSTLGTMSGNVILEASKKKVQAWKWISWLATKEPMLIMSKSKQGQLPVLSSAQADTKYTSDPALKVAIAAQKTAVSWPALPGTGVVANKSWGPTIQAAFLGSTDSATMLNALAKDLGSA